MNTFGKFKILKLSIVDIEKKLEEEELKRKKEFEAK